MRARRKCTASRASTCAKEPKFRKSHAEFLEFMRDAELIIHNAPFDIAFLNAELRARLRARARRRAVPRARHLEPRAANASRPAQQSRRAVQTLFGRQLAPRVSRRVARCAHSRGSVSGDDRRPGGLTLERRVRHLRARAPRGSLAASARRTPAHRGRFRPTRRSSRRTNSRSRCSTRRRAAKPFGGSYEASGHGRRGLHRLSHGASAARARRRGRGTRQSQRLLRSGAEGGAPRPAAALPEFSIREDRRRRSRPRCNSLFAREHFQPGRALGSPGRRALLDRESRTSTCRATSTGFLHVIEGCRHTGVEHLVYASTSSVYGANTAMPFVETPERRSPLVALCRDQEGQRTDGPQLLAAVRTADHGLALLHRVRALGPARHGAVSVHEAHSRGAADRCLQSRAVISATSPMSTTSSRA